MKGNLKNGVEGELVQTVTNDGLILDGFLVCPPRRGTKILVYIHGLGSNFYRRVDPDLIKNFHRIGAAILWVNTRGHDTVAKITTTASDKRITIGAERELLSDAYRDIDAWIKRASQLDFQKIFLLGHSLGAVKVGLYVRRGKSLAKVRGVIYASPPDMWNESYLAARQREGLKVAERMIQASKGGELIPVGFMQYSQTAVAYFDKMSPRRGHNVFNFVNGQFRWAKKFKRPQLLLYGDHDEPVKDDNTRKALAVFKRAVPDAETIQIKGANHNYSGKRKVFNSVVARWLRRAL